jgi:carboxylesterase type B
MSIGLHLINPRTKGMFQKAIMQSNPVGVIYKTKADAQVYGEDFCKRAGCKGCDLRCLRSKPIQTLVKAELDAAGSRWNQLRANYKHILGALLDFTPVVDGGVVPSQIITALRSGKYDTSVPVIFGSNAQEGVTFVYDALEKKLSMLLFKAGLVLVWPKRFLTLIKRYEKPSDSGDARAPFSRIATDFLFICPVQQFAVAQQKAGKQSWVYRFDHVYSNPSMFVGLIPKQCASSVCHGVDLPITFHNGPTENGKYQSNTHSEDALSDMMIGYWTNFARTGNPNGKGLPQWDTFDSKTRSVFVIGDDSKPTRTGGMVSYADACALWDGIGYGTGGPLRFKQVVDQSFEDAELEEQADEAEEEECEEEEEEEFAENSEL